ncbi:hypothetical protein [Stenotrophomonas bentonitica]
MGSEQVQEKLKAWFNNTGFPLEIYSSRAFHRARFAVEQSAIYLDTDEEKGREIDLLAYVRDATSCFASFFAIECKSSDKPWIVLTNKSQYSRFGALSIAALSGHARIAIGAKVSDYVLAYEDYLGPSSGGYALKQAFAGQTDLAYAASMGSVKAASAIVEREKSALAFGFPVIVVNTPIYEYSESHDGKQQFEEVRASSFEFSAYLGRHTRSVIRIVSKEYLSEFTVQCAELAQRYERLFAAEVREASVAGT